MKSTCRVAFAERGVQGQINQSSNQMVRRRNLKTQKQIIEAWKPRFEI
jgi:hypothetical protein